MNLKNKAILITLLKIIAEIRGGIYLDAWVINNYVHKLMTSPGREPLKREQNSGDASH